MADIDADRYVASLSEMHATVAMINVAGIIASYPTSLPFHFQSPYLTGSSLAEIIDACHDAGIKVIARTDFSKVRKPLYEEHPEWACRYGDGVIEDYNGNVHCCINGEYQRRYAPQIIREAITALPVDGIFFNMGGYLTRNYSHEYLGICRCASCRTRFAEMYGRDLPARESPSDPAYHDYLAFKRRTVDEYRRSIVTFIESIRPEIAIDHNTVSGTGFYRQESNTEIGRALPHWQYSASENTKRVVTSWPGLVSSNASVDFMGFPLRHTAVSPHQQELRLWQNLANCGGLDYYLIGRLDNHHDRSAFEAVRRVFVFHEGNFDKTYRSLKPVANVLLVRGTGDEGEYRGWFRVLTEHHVPFGVCAEERLSAIELAPYRAILTPDLRCLSEEGAASLDAFVEAGGTLIASGRYELEEEYQLECLGLATKPFVRTDMRSAVLSVDDHERFPSLSERDLIAVGDTFVFGDYEADDATESHLRLIPPHEFGPPERCYWSLETDVPGIVVRRHGRGRAIFIPWMPGAFYYREGHDNTALFMADVVTSFAEVQAIGGTLSPMVEVSLAQPPSKSFTLLQLVNASGHFGTSYFPPVSMRDVHLELSANEKPVSVTRLSDGSELPFAWNAGRLSVDLDELWFFEAIKIARGAAD